MGSITFDEIYRYVSNVNEMSHVRMYPESNDEEFVPVSGGEIPDLTFLRASSSMTNPTKPLCGLPTAQRAVYRYPWPITWGMTGRSPGCFRIFRGTERFTFTMEILLI